jgi:ribosomal-protein-alanine acetyltransferase
LSIRAIKPSDIEAILVIQSASPEIAQWTARDYARVAAGEMAGWAVEEGERITGFSVARRPSNNLEILNFAVRPDGRNKGVGALLLREVLDWAKSFSSANAFLEVRSSNLVALRFYERHGFAVTGRRTRYYASPIEDALVLVRTLR